MANENLIKEGGKIIENILNNWNGDNSVDDMNIASLRIMAMDKRLVRIISYEKRSVWVMGYMKS